MSLDKDAVVVLSNRKQDRAIGSNVMAGTYLTHQIPIYPGRSNIAGFHGYPIIIGNAFWKQ